MSTKCPDEFPLDRFSGCHLFDQSIFAIIVSNAYDSRAISYPESSGFLVSGATPGRLWGHRILLPQDFCGKTMETVTEQPIKKIEFFRCPQSLPGVAPLTKKPEDSGYEIDSREEMYTLPEEMPAFAYPWRVRNDNVFLSKEFIIVYIVLAVAVALIMLLKWKQECFLYVKHFDKLLRAKCLVLYLILALIVAFIIIIKN